MTSEYPIDGIELLPMLRTFRNLQQPIAKFVLAIRFASHYPHLKSQRDGFESIMVPPTRQPSSRCLHRCVAGSIHAQGMAGASGWGDGVDGQPKVFQPPGCQVTWEGEVTAKNGRFHS